MTRTCPDCGVAMEETAHKTNYSGDGLRVDTGGGVLSVLELTGTDAQAVVCPECGLIRFYAPVK